MTLLAVGTFAAQALATGYVSRTAQHNRAAASGIYLCSYFLGGMAGTAVLGQLFDQLGWPATVAGIGLALGMAVVLASLIEDPHT
jgi:predicted MFS family arabinose efflux permease